MKNSLHRTSATAFFLVALATFGCSSEASSGTGKPLSDETIRSFEGLYQLESFTLNSAGCDTEGASTLATVQEPLFVVVGGDALGTPYLNLASCANEAHCQSIATDILDRTPYSAEYSLFLSEELGTDTLGGFLASTGFDSGDLCTGRQYVDHSLIRQGTTVTIESRTTALPDAPKDEGYCVVEPKAAKAEASSLPCSQLQTFSATKLGALP